MKKQLGLLTSFTLAMSLLAGCASPTPEEIHEQQSMHTQMSAPISFKKTDEAQQKTAYVNIHNHSAIANFEIENKTKQALQSKGYRIVNAPDKAHYLLEANVMSITSETHREKTFFEKYGTYRIVTEVQISERTKEAIREGSEKLKPIKLAQHDKEKKLQYDTSDIQAYMNVSHWNRMKTTFTSTVEKADQEFNKVKTQLENQLVEALVQPF